MAQNLSTELRQQQRLTPLQVQLVRMLEMTGPEIEDEVQRALDEMPALEAVPPEETSHTDLTEDGASFSETDRDLQRADYRSDDDIPDYLESSSREDRLYGPVSVFSPRGAYDPSMPDTPVADDSVSLVDSLRRQIAELQLDETQSAIASYIAGSIDDNGYLTRSVNSIADDLAINEGIEATPDTVRKMVELVQTLEPAGIGASDLRECLLLQLRRMSRTTARLTAEEILTRHFDLFSKKHFDRIARMTGIEMPRLKEAIELITRLNPKPASALASSGAEGKSRHITPDFFVEHDPSGAITVTSLNRIPELRVEATFASDDLLAPAPQSSATPSRQLEEARMFLRSKRDDARNFIRVISMRQQTLFNVVSAIVKLQHDFFLSDDDDEALRPMVLRDVAAVTGLDLSVISRATQGKYLATLHGVYPLKKFFNEKISDTDDSITAGQVMARIKTAVEAENPARPLSDREITQLLNDEGFPVARRTVAKYRENLGFPVARLRKRL